MIDSVSVSLIALKVPDVFALNFSRDAPRPILEMMDCFWGKESEML